MFQRHFPAGVRRNWLPSTFLITLCLLTTLLLFDFRANSSTVTTEPAEPDRMAALQISDSYGPAYPLFAPGTPP
ncbi:MAG: hypothetical protein R3264_18820, partial [Anaerolineae bacterium]|nr:hypothetical protein [Anaerolineae bacterium]